jgi:hypothetical protein
MYEFERGFQPRSNLVKNENGELLADSHNTANRWKNYYSHLLDVYSVNDVRQKRIEICTYELLAPDYSPFNAEIDIANLKSVNHQAMIKFK